MSEWPMYYFSNYKCQNIYLYNGFGALLTNLDNHRLKTLIGVYPSQFFISGGLISLQNYE